MAEARHILTAGTPERNADNHHTHAWLTDADHIRSMLTHHAAAMRNHKGRQVMQHIAAAKAWRTAITECLD